MSAFPLNGDAKWVEVSASAPCPVCQSASWCRHAPDHTGVVCRRLSDGPLGPGKRDTDKSGGEFWYHRLVTRSSTNGNGKAWEPPRYSHTDGGGERADPDTLNRVYTALLDNLPFSSAHARALQARGLNLGRDNAWRPSAGYRTLGASRARAARAVVEAGLEEHLPRVPGFYVAEKDGRRFWSLKGRGGLLVPVRDGQGRIVGMLSRADDADADAKYTWLSSKKVGGAPSGAHVHHPLFDGDTTTVRVTEGALKADIATALSGVLTIGLPGVGVWSRAAKALSAIGAKVARLALDADARTNRTVAQALQSLAVDLLDKGFAVELERWDIANGKGIDDLLAAKKQPELLTGDAVMPAIEEIFAAAEAADPRPGAAVPEGHVLEADDDPHRLARVFLVGAEAATENQRVPADKLFIRFWREEYHEWGGTAYRTLHDKEIRARQASSIKDEFDRLNRLALERYRLREQAGETEDGEGPPQVKRVTQRLVGDTAQALAGITLLRSAVEPPAWIGGAGPFPADEVLAANNMLVHLPSLVSGKSDFSHPPTLEFFSFNSLGYDFDLDAPAPAAWLEFLHGLWPEDPESVRTLQEWIGYLLTPDTRQQKILMLVGPKRSGKGTIARVIRGLIGSHNVCGPTLSSLGTNFGLWPLLGKTAAIVSDARLSGRTDAATVTERLLSISGEDALTIDRKHMSPVTTKLLTRFSILTNELPRLGDSSGALAGRFIVLRLTESWYGRENHALTDKLLTELPGILLWAVEGWRRLRERGHFIQPAASKELLGEMEDLSSPVGAFVKERCEVGPGFQVPKAQLYGTWKLWCEERGREPGDAAVFGRNLRAALPALSTTQPRDGEKRVWVYEGIKLAPIGCLAQGGTSAT